MFRFLLVTFVLTIGVNADFSVTLENLLNGMKTKLQKEGVNCVKLANINQPFEFNFFEQKYTGEFRASEGEIKNVTEFRKKATSFKEESNKKNVIVTLFLEKSNIIYKTYSFKYLTFSTEGGIEILRSNGEATIEFSLIKNGTSCIAQAERAILNKLGDIQTEFIGARVPEQFFLYIESWVLYHFYHNERHNIEKQIFNALSDNLKDTDFCKDI